MMKVMRTDRLLAALCAVPSMPAASGWVPEAASILPPRPVIKAAPFDAGAPMPYSPPRDAGRYCRVVPAAAGNSTGTGTGNGNVTSDDGPAILRAFRRCNDGGTVVLDGSYLVRTPLDLTFLAHVDVVITGTVAFDDDVYGWAGRAFRFGFQNMTAFWRWGGVDVNIWGDLRSGARSPSTLDGRAERYWAEAETNSSLLRPILFAMEGMKGATMSNLRMRNSPMWFNIIANSSDVIISNMDIRAESLHGSTTANSDGWDTYRSERIVIQDSVIVNSDDCVSLKPNSTSITIQNLDCTGSHGISVGSLGQYAGEVDVVEDVYVYNNTMRRATDAARIKVWPGIQTDFQDLLNGGGGRGRVRNVTYDLFAHDANDRAITITQCYGQRNETLCRLYPANLTISDVTLKNFHGTVSSRYDPEAGSLVCSAPDHQRCSNIRVDNVTVRVPSGKPAVYECENVDRSLLQITCAAGGDKEVV